MARMIFVFVTTLAMAAAAAAQTGTWQIDPNHTAAQFAVRHLGVSTVRGAFTKVTGSAQYDPADPSKMLRGDDRRKLGGYARTNARQRFTQPALLRCAKVSDHHFSSKQTKVVGQGKLQITGDLTIHGVTKEVVLDVDGPSAPIKDPMGKGLRMGASATTKINRQDFGVSALPGPVGDEITITIDTELIQPPK